MNVLVLCTGNRWRSPLLAACFRLKRPEWNVRSAGTKCSHPGADVPKRWREDSVVDIGPHEAKRITQEAVDWADVIVGVQESHRTAVLAMKPSARIIIHRLPDPAFKQVTQWPTMAAHVVASADVIVSMIESEAHV